MATATKGVQKPPTAATPWGSAALVEEAVVPQRVGDKRFSVVVQLLETPGGERLVRFAYTTDGAARRGPVTMRARDLERLRAALERAPVLKEVLGLQHGPAGPVLRDGGAGSTERGRGVDQAREQEPSIARAE